MTHDDELALAAFQWIKGLVMMGAGESALAPGASPPPHPTLYQTTVTDEEVLLSDGPATHVPGLRLTLQASGRNGHTVALNDSTLEAEDYSFSYMMADDLLHLALSVGTTTCRGRDGLYRVAQIAFTPSGKTFRGRISQHCPGQPVLCRWEGAVLLGG